MATAILTANIVTLDADDRRAALFAIAAENVNRTNINQSNVFTNQRLLANIPPLPIIADLPMLPFSTGAEIRASYEICLAKVVIDHHKAKITEATEAAATSANLATLKPLWADATPAKRAAALAALA